MTGIEVGATSSSLESSQVQEGSTLQSFLHILTTTFFKFYLFALACLILITLTADLLISDISRQTDEFQQKRFLRASYLLTESDLLRFPQETWATRIQIMNQKYAFTLGLSSRASLGLSEAQTYLLDRHEIASSADERYYYLALGKSNMVLTVPRYLQGQDMASSMQIMGLSRNTLVRLSSWLITSILFSVALWFWGRPIFHDMDSLRRTAEAIGEGNLTVRLANVESRLFKPLAATLNSMADRIQHLVNVQRELSTAISHELRTPIARLNFISEMISEAETMEECQRLSTMMENDLADLDRLLESSLTYSRFERDNLKLSLAPVRIAEWLEDQVDTMRILGQHLDLRVDTSMLPPGLMLMIDENRMSHAVSNLLRNATKYAKHKIQVSVFLRGDQIQVCIDDDGIGIPPNEREHIFDAFTRLDRSRDRATGGHGLGLPISLRVVELHGGSIKASESPLGGARFTMSWPVQTPPHDEVG